MEVAVCAGHGDRHWLLAESWRQAADGSLAAAVADVGGADDFSNKGRIVVQRIDIIVLLNSQKPLGI